MQLKSLDKYIIEDIEVEDHPSDFIKREDLASLILRLPELQDDIKITSYAFILHKNFVYKYNRDSKELEELGSVDILSNLLNSKIDKLILDVKKLHLEVDKMEESLYGDVNSLDFMNRWLDYKKRVSLIDRLMFHASITMDIFLSYLKKENFTFNIHAIEDINEEIKRVNSLSKVILDKLDNLYSFYRAKVDEKMNKNIYYLTILSGIFLPLTLITGFFGMNTGGLPLADDSNGTLKVVVISLISELLFFILFWLWSKRG